MTKISTAYDYYLTQLSTLFSAKTRIPNPYSIEDNNIQLLRDGYGLRMGGHDLTSTDFKTISQNYDFVVSFTKEVITLDNNPTSFDSAVKDIMEDVFTLREFFYDIDNNNPTIDQINLGTTDPVGFFIAGKNNFVFVETTISTLIRELY